MKIIQTFILFLARRVLARARRMDPDHPLRASGHLLCAFPGIVIMGLASICKPSLRENLKSQAT